MNIVLTFQSYKSAVIFDHCVYIAGIGLSLLNTSTHISNTMYVLVDFAVVGMPVRLLHVWHSAVYFLSYGAFTYIYYQCGGLVSPFCFTINY